MNEGIHLDLDTIMPIAGTKLRLNRSSEAYTVAVILHFLVLQCGSGDVITCLN